MGCTMDWRVLWTKRKEVFGLMVAVLAQQNFGKNAVIPMVLAADTFKQKYGEKFVEEFRRCWEAPDSSTGVAEALRQMAEGYSFPCPSQLLDVTRNYYASRFR